MAFDPITEGLGLARAVLDKFFPNADQETKLKFEAASQEIQNEYSLAIEQVKTNQEEAKNPHWFVAGARPFIVWIGGLGLAYDILLKPILNGFLLVFGLPPVFTGVDVNLLQTLVGGILGLGLARSYDKKNGADTKNFK